jgi:hypothetical protein
VARGDAEVAVELSALFARINKPSQLRMGSHYSFEDLRNSPAVLIAAFNNRWTLQMTSNMPFVFAEKDGQGRIEERKPAGRVWSPRLGARGEVTADYAIVARQFDSKTGRLLIVAAGIGPRGTQAAGDFIAREDYLADALRAAPRGWQRKNLEVVLETDVIDTIPGPPRVVVAQFW